MHQEAQVDLGRRTFVACLAVVAVAEVALATACAAVLGDWTLLLTGVGRVGVLAFVSRWALSGRRWGRVALAVWLGGHVVLSALGAIFVASSPDWVLGWAPHNPAVRSLPGCYWAFPTARLIVLLAAGLAVFGSPDVAAFWADQRGRRVAALSPLASASLAAGILAFAAWRAAVTGLGEPRATVRRGAGFQPRHGQPSVADRGRGADSGSRDAS
jgi:hypothetical protein